MAGTRQTLLPGHFPTPRSRTANGRLLSMRILQVIHGYPMRFNAGSEVYTQSLAQGLAERHQVHVFTRQEDPFAPDYAMLREQDPDDPRVQLHLVNMPNSRDRY